MFEGLGEFETLNLIIYTSDPAWFRIPVRANAVSNIKAITAPPKALTENGMTKANIAASLPIR